jgi:hypothetical protein
LVRRRVMRGNRKRTAKERWQRSHGVKVVYTTRAEAQRAADAITVSQPDKPYTAYECRWAENYHHAALDEPHFHTGRVMNGRT